MALSNLPNELTNQPVTTEAGPEQRKGGRVLALSFCAVIVLLAVFQFSENTADPDLWGHIVFGQHMLHSGGIAKTEIYSWTAQGQPWVNHECLAELALGGAHALMGGSGPLLLKMVAGLLTFGLCLRMGSSNLSWPTRAIAWGFGGLAVVEISYGFAARPQIFTALFLALELWVLRRIHAGSWRWALVLPFLFAIWINTHGGVLAGFGLLGLAAMATTAQFFWSKRRSNEPSANGTDGSNGLMMVLWLSVVAAGTAMLCNPWKAELLRWLIGSVLWLRPEIEEWNPTPFGWDHAALFILVALSAFAWVFSRRKRAWWEVAGCAAFAILALRSVRNAPLCGVVALALVPAHLADALARFRNYFERWEELCGRANVRAGATYWLTVFAVGIGFATFKLHKEHALTMEVPRKEYPTAAVDFLREQQLSGRMLVFFDWGEMVIFHLPDCAPSVDGRLDTCYPRELITAHWKLYNGEAYDQKVLDPDKADLALLPANLVGAGELAKRPGWKAVYFDDTAVVLARDVERFPKLQRLKLPVVGAKTAGEGRVVFADRSAR
jgi:hypothetical protein